MMLMDDSTTSLRVSSYSPMIIVLEETLWQYFYRASRPKAVVGCTKLETWPRPVLGLHSSN